MASLLGLHNAVRRFFIRTPLSMLLLFWRALVVDPSAQTFSSFQWSNPDTSRNYLSCCFKCLGSCEENMQLWSFRVIGFLWFVLRFFNMYCLAASPPAQSRLWNLLLNQFFSSTTNSCGELKATVGASAWKYCVTVKQASGAFPYKARRPPEGNRPFLQSGSHSWSGDWVLCSLQGLSSELLALIQPFRNFLNPSSHLSHWFPGIGLPQNSGHCSGFPYSLEANCCSASFCSPAWEELDFVTWTFLSICFW